MDNVFSEIKSRLAMPEVARFYGLEVNRAGMACCPFHDDKSPSLKVYDDHFYCFGCGATGDQTGFVAKLFGLRQIDAAKKISEDFGLGLFDRGIAVPIKIAPNPKYEMQKWISEARLTVKEYLTELYKWHRDYAPRNQDDEFHPLFVESLQKIDYIEYLRDILSRGSEEDKRDLYENGKAEIEKIRKRLDSLSERQPTMRRAI
ncbi:MAG: DNA primase [Oscillospiraceae bacterium]|nr:DNA primase [Oscillospiraceae bacterium]